MDKVKDARVQQESKLLLLYLFWILKLWPDVFVTEDSS